MSEENYRNLAWACRRGMLELDYMVMPFYENRFSSLSDEQKSTFAELLDFTDPELFNWLMRQKPAPSTALQEMVELIRAFLADKS